MVCFFCLFLCNLICLYFLEFFLNSHTTIQGTARTPKYTILYNNNDNVSMDAIQHMTYYLCFGHQIVQSPTSLPSPVSFPSLTTVF